MSACSMPKGMRVVLLAVLSTSIWVPTLQAATQGSVGASSNGSLEISLTLGAAVRVSGLQDIELNATQGQDISGTSKVCIYSSGGNTFQLNALGSGQDNSFSVNFGSQSIDLNVVYSNDQGDFELEPGVRRSSTLGTSADDIDCSTNGPQGRVSVSIDGADSMSAETGTYLGTLTLVVAAE
ncbi:MAG: hypothetical protein ACI96M_004247 [Candidatus Azotimanducaceae bacterium]|jgi:hypothetical protein